MISAVFSALAGVILGLAIYGGQGRPVHEEVGLVVGSTASIGLVLGLLGWIFQWRNRAKFDRRRSNRFGGEEERRRIERQLSRETAQRITGEVVAAAWWENQEGHGAACVLDVGADRLLLIMDLMKDTLSRASRPKTHVEVEFLEELRDLISVRFDGEAVATVDLSLDDFPAPANPDRYMLTTWFPGEFRNWAADLERLLATS